MGYGLLYLLRYHGMVELTFGNAVENITENWMACWMELSHVLNERALWSWVCLWCDGINDAFWKLCLGLAHCSCLVQCLPEDIIPLFYFFIFFIATVPLFLWTWGADESIFAKLTAQKMISVFLDVKSFSWGDSPDTIVSWEVEIDEDHFQDL